MLKKAIIFILALLFIVGVGLWVWQGNLFSKEILHIEVDGSEKATVGEEITYTVRYKNNGSFVLENLKLMFVMPSNSLTEDSKTLIIQNLEDINPGQERSVDIKTRLLGKEGDVKTAKVSLTYSPKNLTARYELRSTFNTTLNQVPVDLAFDFPPNAEKGKPMEYTLTYSSEVDYPLENLSLKLEPVAGFAIKSASPRSLNNIEWKIASLQKGQGGSIALKGEIAFNADNTLPFKASLGVWQNGSFVVIKETTWDLEVAEPSVSAVEISCLQSGGTVATAACYCEGTPDFYNTCSVGACSCNPLGGVNRQVKVCTCGEGRCFDGTNCVPQ